jgi:superfamily II DNA or RNA helicase
VWKDRKDPYNDCPIEETGTLMYLLRKVVNQNEDRLRKVLEIIQNHQRVIVFYNYNYELDDLRKLCREHEIAFGEWNGDVHSPIPDTERWAYLVQYIAGCEGWNCLTCNCMIFYSQTYSYKQLTQAKWRIDRLTTPFKDLWYYHFKSSAPIDLAIARSLAEKKEFNERKFLKGGGKV